MTTQDRRTRRAAAEELEQLAIRIARAYRDLASDRDLGRDLAVDSVRAVVRAHAHDLTLSHILDLDLDLDLDRALDRDLNRALALASDVARDRDLDSVRAGTRELAGLFEGVAAAARTVAEQQGRDGRPEPVAPTASRRAVQVSAAAARLLPPPARARAREEFHAELDGLAAAGAGRRAQLGHALRLLTRAGAHRRALRVPHPGREGAR